MISFKKYRVKTGEKEREYPKKIIAQMREDKQIPDTGEVFDKKKKSWINVDTFLAQFEEAPKAKPQASKQSTGGKYDKLSLALISLTAIGTGFLVFTELSNTKLKHPKTTHSTHETSLIDSIKEEHTIAHNEEHDAHAMDDAHAIEDPHASNTHTKHEEPPIVHSVQEAAHSEVHLPDALNFEAGNKPSPEVVLEILKEGNKRFYTANSLFPHINESRMRLASTAKQADYAYATVLSCSDSVVPPELLFDAGIMDLFVVRVAGNVCNTDEIGSIEYGLSHVQTPVLVVLGHTHCDAVKLVTHAKQGKANRLERNIPPLLASIEPAVEKAIHEHPYVLGDSIIPYAVEENVWQSIKNLFKESPVVRQLVRAGEVKVIGAIYNVGTGQIEFLEEEKSVEILVEVEWMEDKATNIYAKGHKAPAKH